MKPAPASIRRVLLGFVVVFVAAAAARAVDAGPAAAPAFDAGVVADAGPALVDAGAAPPTPPPTPTPTPQAPPTPAELTEPVVEDAGPLGEDGGVVLVDAGPADALP
jgi:hypothetical protein